MQGEEAMRFRFALQTFALSASLGIAATASAQSCRLDYQRALSPAAPPKTAGMLGFEQLVLGANQQQQFVTDQRFASTLASGTVHYGSNVRTVVNSGTEPLSLALLGNPSPALPSAPGIDVAQATGGLSGGVVQGGVSGGVVLGGLSGGVVERVSAQNGSWILLQPGARASELHYDLAAVACGGTNGIVRGVTAVLLRAPSGDLARGAGASR
jgi:hypothetical protein